MGQQGHSNFSVSKRYHHYKKSSCIDLKLPLHIPRITTLEHLFKNYLDICGRPRRFLLHLLSFFTCSEAHAEKLRELGSREGQEEWTQYVPLVKRTTLEVLTDFPARCPLNYILDLVPPMRPRSFSIASAGVLGDASVDLTVGIVRYKTRLSVERRGVCTRWMAEWTLGGTSVSADDDYRKGCLYYWTGNDAAGSRSKYSSDSGGSWDWDCADAIVFRVSSLSGCPRQDLLDSRLENMLFTGCRYRDKDDLYRQSWDAHVAQGHLVCYAAYSRDSEDRVYVQDVMLQNGPRVWEWITRGAHIYVSGYVVAFVNPKRNAKVPDGVSKALVQMGIQVGGLSEEEAHAFVKEMQQTRRYQSETWS